MTAPPIFPVILGMGYPLTKSPAFGTGIFEGASRWRLRVVQAPSVIWKFKLTFDGLDVGGVHPGLTSNSLQLLMGFFLDLFGAYGSFLLWDPNDSTLANANIGTGDGTTTTFTITRTMGSIYAEPVGYVFSSDISQVKVAGTPTTSYTWLEPNQIVFGTAPTSGQAVTITVNKFYFECTMPDTADFEELMSGLYDMEELEVMSLVPNYPAVTIG